MIGNIRDFYGYGKNTNHTKIDPLPNWDHKCCSTILYLGGIAGEKIYKNAKYPIILYKLIVIEQQIANSPA